MYLNWKFLLFKNKNLEQNLQINKIKEDKQQIHIRNKI